MKGGEEIEKGARSTVKDESLREQKKNTYCPAFESLKFPNLLSMFEATHKHCLL